MAEKWAPPSDFAAFCVNASYVQMEREYGVHPREIKKALAELPDEVLAARKAALRDKLANQGRASAEKTNARKRQEAEARKKGEAPKPVDLFMPAYADVAARRGWRVWEYRA